MATKITLCLLLALPILFTNCEKQDDCKKVMKYTYYEAVYKTKDEVRANIKSNGPQPIEKPGKISILGSTIFLNEIDKGIHVIDNRNPALPKNIAFIDIPGNLDIAVKGNILYADMYTDLVAIDISNPSKVKVTKFVENLFPPRYYLNTIFAAPSAINSDMVVASWIKKEKTVVYNSCQTQIDPVRRFDGGQFFAASASPNTSASPIGVGGSMARFTIINNRLYTVSSSELGVYNITNTADPKFSNRITLGWGIETIYPFKNKLFIGSSAGMFTYDVANPDAPSKTGEFSHVRSCDPVIADDDFAYVTLRSGTVCQGFTNELDVLKLNNFTNPALLKVYPMTNPHGLSKDETLLFICDGADGLKIYQASDAMNLKLIKQFTGFETYDVIAYNKIALVVAKDGLYQYSYAKVDDIKLLSKLTIK